MKVEFVLVSGQSAVHQRYESFRLEHSVSPSGVEKLAGLSEVVEHLMLEWLRYSDPGLYPALDHLVVPSDFYLLVDLEHMVDEAHQKLTCSLSWHLSGRPSKDHPNARSIDVPSDQSRS